MARDENFDVVVIGAGVLGAWSAYSLAQSRLRVLVIDAYGAGNNRASSGGETRIIRMGYGPDEIYTLSAKRSLSKWQELAKESQQELFHRTGVLWLNRTGESYAEKTLQTLARTGVVFEKLSRSDLDHRYPQLNFESVDWSLLEPDSGVLMARQSVMSVMHEAGKLGVQYMTGAVEYSEGVSRLDSITTADGRRIAAGQFVFACGPWLPKIFPRLLSELIHVTRQEVCFFGIPAGDDRFGKDSLPAWVDFNDLVYALPDIDARGVKIAIDAHGPTFDPDSTNRTIGEEGLAAVRQRLAKRLPALANSPVTETRVCQYENTSNGDFLIDRHPDVSNVWLVGGGSGHGFKHGPAIGEYVAGLVLDGSAVVEPRFGLLTKRKVQQREVY